MPHALVLVLTWIFALLVLALGVLLLTACILKQIIPLAIERYSREVLSVEAKCERVDIALFTRRVSAQDLKDVACGIAKLSMQDLTLESPTGYASPYLLKAGTAVIGVSVPRLLCSGFKKIVLRELAFKDVDANLEIKDMSSNMKEVLAFVDSGEARQGGGGQLAQAGLQATDGAARGAPGPQAGSRSSRLLDEHDAVMRGRGCRAGCLRGLAARVRRASSQCFGGERARMVKVEQVVVEGATVKICAHFLGGQGVEDVFPDTGMGRPRKMNDLIFLDLAQDFDLPGEVVHVILRKFVQAAVEEGSKSGSYGVLTAVARGPFAAESGAAVAAVRSALAVLEWTM